MPQSKHQPVTLTAMPQSAYAGSRRVRKFEESADGKTASYDDYAALIPKKERAESTRER